MDNPNNKVIELEKRIKYLENLIFKDNYSGIYIERKDYSHIGNKLGFYNLPPITQPQSSGESTGAVLSGSTVGHTSTFNGNNGSSAYTISDIVKHLKNLGLLKK